MTGRGKWHGKLLAMATLWLMAPGCGYQSPPIETRMSEDGGGFLIWWEADNSAAYWVKLGSWQCDTEMTVPRPETIAVRNVIYAAWLCGLDENGRYRGSESFWEPPEQTLSVDIIYPLSNKPGAGPFGIGVDSSGHTHAVDWSNLDSAGPGFTI
jgi:hypothetical protein